MNKKGFELSATVIVLLVITIVIFIGSMFFLKTFFTGAQEIKGEIERSTQEQIENLLRTGDLVAIPLNKKTIKRGNGEIFGLGIRNVGAQKDFTVISNFPYKLDSNELKLVPVSITVDHAIDDYGTSTKSGTYVFNVCVFKGINMMDCDLEAFKTTGFPEELYNKKVYQMLVVVP